MWEAGLDVVDIGFWHGLGDSRLHRYYQSWVDSADVLGFQLQQSWLLRLQTDRLL